MDFVITSTYLGDILHKISQALMAPDILLLLAFIVYAIWCVGGIVVEVFTERRNFKINMPRFLADLMAAEQSQIPAVVQGSGLLNRQKTALLTVYDYRVLPDDAKIALIRRIVSQEESRYDRITGRNNMAARIAPMLGLMGTLIPLGPGIAALGSNDIETLSSSLLLAFDTTVAGLVVAAVCLVVAKIRGNWYANYMSALDSAMATMLQKIDSMRQEGLIDIVEPSDYAFLHQTALKGKAPKKATIVEVDDLSAPAAAQSQATASQAEVATGAEALSTASAGPTGAEALPSDPAPDAAAPARADAAEAWTPEASQEARSTGEGDAS